MSEQNFSIWSILKAIWNFIIGLFRKKEEKSNIENVDRDQETYEPASATEVKEDPKSRDPWQFLKDIAKKIFGLNKNVQDDILKYGKKLKAAGVSFILMIESSPGLPRSPAKEKSKKDKQKQGLQ